MMKTNPAVRDRLARDIFLRAVEIQSPEAQAAYLEGACQQDASLRTRVDALLESHRQDTFLERAAVDRAPTLADASPQADGPGARIGRYKLLQQIGDGGMGVVYMAEQEEPVRRRVALKIIKLGMDTRQVIARFEAERQALALMDHPNIAKVLDGGTTENGRPFFVMELVQGVPITEFCDKARLGSTERLKLLIQVCHAVQSAHQKGIIHRDLKPSNILVTLHHGEPMPKVIDFGIAKATNQKLTEKTLFTQYATLIGTPAYMSPEQAEMTSMDVDTRTDIYSLGVLLYELLTGSTPFPEKRLRSLGYGEMQRVIADEEPERPSTRVSTLAEEQKTVVAKNRGENLADLGRVLRGDLDWIVMRCLEKDRTRRYDTANGLAADLQRHLNNEPVTARPPSAAYKLQKAWRRNKLAYSAGLAVAVALLAGVVVSTWQAGVARRAQKASEQAALAEGRQRLVALRERDEAQESRREALQQRQAAEEARRRSDAEMYAADIGLAQRALESHNLGQARELLRRHGPRKDGQDRRGWEWRYLWQKSRRDGPLRLFTETNGPAVAAVSPNGRWMAVTAFPRGNLTVLDISNPHATRLVETTPGYGNPVMSSLAFSPTEPLLAWSSAEDWYGTNQQPVHLWNFQKQTNVVTLQFRSVCTTLAFSQDGRKLLIRTIQGKHTPSELILWNCQDGTELARHSTLGDFSPYLGVTPDLSLAVYRGRSNTIQAFDLIAGKERQIAALPQRSPRVEAVAISSDGRWLATTEGSPEVVLRLRDVATGRDLVSQPTGHAASVNTLLFLADGRTLASSSDDQTIRLWDFSPTDGIRLKRRPLLGEGGPVSTLSALPDGRSFVSASGDGSVYLWDAAAEPRDESELILPGVTDWQFSSDSQTLFTIEQTNRVMRRQGPGFTSATHLLDLPPNAGLSRVISPDGFLAVPTSEGVIQLYDLRERRLVREFGRYEGWVGAIQMPAGRRRLLIQTPGGQRYYEWNLETFQFTPLTREGESPALCYSSDAEWLLKAEFDGRFTFSRFSTGESRAQKLEIGRVSNAVFSSDDRFFAAGSHMGYASVWETASLRQVATVGRRQLPEWVGGFSPDGRRLLTFSSALRGALKLWDLETGRELLNLSGGAGSFSPDGNVLAQLGAEPDTVHLRFAPTLAEIDRIESAAEKAPPP